MIVRAPRRATEWDILLLLDRHRGWIEKHLAEAQAREREMGDIEKLTTEEIRELAEKAAKYIPGRVRYYAPMIGVTYGRITIRKMKTLWGSCSGNGNLSFNCLLMLAPKEVIDSVVVHELCHRKEMNHSKKFYEEVVRVFPEYWVSSYSSFLQFGHT